MKNIKVLGLAIVASIVAAPAFAGETYVRNDWTKSTGVTKSNLHMNSHTSSNRNEDYSSYASKVSYGSATNGGDAHHDFDSKDYSIHTSGSHLSGHFSESNTTNVSGDINSKVKTSSFSHETSGGVR